MTHREHATQLLLQAYTELVEELADTDDGDEYVIVSAVADIIDHAKRVLVGEDRPYRHEKAQTAQRAATRLVSLLDREVDG